MKRLLHLPLSLFIVNTAFAAIAVDKTVTTNRSTSAKTIVSPALTTTSPSELLLAFIATDYQSGTNTSVSSVTATGLTWVLVRRTNVQKGTAEIWRAFAPAILTNVTVTANLSQSVAATLTVMTFTGTDTTGTNGSGAIGTVGGGSAAAGAPAASLVTTRANSLVVGVGNDFDNAISRTLGPGQTMVNQYLATIGDTYWIQRQTNTTPLSGTTVTINDTVPTTDQYNLSIAEILTSVSTIPDITVTKTHSGSFLQGQIGATYTITVTNSGGAATTGTIGVIDTLPTGLTATAIAGTGWTCSPLPALSCTRSDALASGASYPAVLLTVNMAANAPATVTNTATVSGGGESNTTNDSASDLTSIVSPADLTVTKTHTGAFIQGQTGAVYTITVKNSGGSPTSGAVTMVDTLPAGLAATAIGGSGWNCTLATLTCTQGSALAGGASYSAITVTVNVASDALPSVVNTATVSGGNQSNTANDTANDTTAINAPSDLTITKSHAGDFTQGQIAAAYTITVANIGAVATSGTVTMVDALPAGLTATAIAGSGWTCTLATLTCTQSTALAGGSSYLPITVTVNVAGNALASVTNTATVSGGGEIATANDVVTDPTTIVQVPDITVTKTHSGSFIQGQTGAVYTITVTNSGGYVSSGAVGVTDTLPAGLTATAFGGAGWTCDPLPALSCTRSDSLAPGASYPAVLLTVNVASNAPASVTNTAAVSGGGESNTANDNAIDLTGIVSPADLTVTKTHSGAFLQGQSGAVYTITVKNSGGSSTSGTITMVDTLPAGLTATAISGSGWTCALATLTCTQSTALAGGANYSAITVTVNVASNAPSSVVNTATVSGGNESNTANDTANDTTAINPPPPPASVPVLVITSAANPFTKYYSEIMNAEGLNYYLMSDLSLVTPTTLSGYDVAVLGEMPLTDANVTMFTDWVNAGGKLIAMRPDKKLAATLGLANVGTTLADAYLKIDSTTSFGTGIVGTTIQYHGPADTYTTLSGTAALATLYQNGTTVTSYPAITLRPVGANGGQAAAFTYDLARSVVLTRQGNVAWAGQQRDGTDGYEASEMFFGAASGAPDWNNLANAAIPIADEQQRLFANMIIQMNISRKPLPRFWYFPRSVKAVVIMTGDDHANGGTSGRFNQYISLSPAGCVVDNWECIRSSSYIYTNTALTNSQAVSFKNQGFEVGLHNTTNCLPWGTLSILDNDYSSQLNAWKQKYSGMPSPVTTRTHCVEWDDWSSQPKEKLKYGIRFDTDYYYYPSNFTQDRPGYFNGTAEIMKFADLDGTTINVYQATTQMTDESGQSYPYTIDTLLNNAYGSAGYYAALTVNAHTDFAASAVSDAVVSSARSRGVPIVSASQMLTWLDARNNSSFQQIAWNGNALSFSVSTAANGLRGMIPAVTAAGTLSSITYAGNPIAFTFDTIKGIQYAIFPALSGQYVASYVVDLVSPVVVSSTPPSGATGVLVNGSITVKFNEPMNPNSISATSISLRDAAQNLVSVSIAYDSATFTATITPALVLNPTSAYILTVNGLGTSPAVTDTAGNALLPTLLLSFTTGSAPPSALIGYNQAGTLVDTGDTNAMNGSRFINGAISNNITSMWVYMKTIAATNGYQMAIYTDVSGKPGSLVAATPIGSLVANSWNSLPINAVLAPNAAYWLMFNTNGNNNMSYDSGSSGQGSYGSLGQPFGSWPSSFGASVLDSAKFSIYAK